MTIETILRQKGTDVATIEPEASVRKAADWLRVKNIGALVVTSGKAVLGIISEREIVHAFSRHGETVASMPVKETSSGWLYQPFESADRSAVALTTGAVAS